MLFRSWGVGLNTSEISRALFVLLFQYLLTAETVLIGILMRRMKLADSVWWSRCVARVSRHWPAGHTEWGTTSSRMLQLYCSCSCFDESILYRASNLCGKDRTRIHRTRHRLFPSLEHCFHTFSCMAVYKSVRVHESREEIPSEIDRVRCSDILHDRIKHI